MKAVRFDEYGGIDVLKVVDVPRPAPRFMPAAARIVNVGGAHKVPLWANAGIARGCSRWHPMRRRLVPRSPSRPRGPGR